MWMKRPRPAAAEFLLGLALAASLAAPRPAAAGPAPAQRLASAFLVYPLIVAEGGGSTRDTRVELVNLSSSAKDLHCFYVKASTCSATNFFVSLTPNQPVSWLASKGSRNFTGRGAVPPFSGTGELKCVVLPSRPEASVHNAVQGRAIVFDDDGQTIGYSAVGFRRLSDGEFDGEVALDGSTYEQCPDELHFVFLASEPGAQSELVLTPCDEDLFNFETTSTVVQFRIINEFEQLLSASISIECYDRRLLAGEDPTPPNEQVSSAFRFSTLGTPTGHVVVRGVQSPVLGLIIDRFTPLGASTSANEPFLRGGRPGLVSLP
jgi:hypothetical protein